VSKFFVYVHLSIIVHLQLEVASYSHSCTQKTQQGEIFLSTFQIPQEIKLICLDKNYICIAVINWVNIVLYTLFIITNDSRTSLFLVDVGANDCIMMSHPPTLHYKTSPNWMSDIRCVGLARERSRYIWHKCYITNDIQFKFCITHHAIILSILILQKWR
jgi:hypothetical protein